MAKQDAKVGGRHFVFSLLCLPTYVAFVAIHGRIILSDNCFTNMKHKNEMFSYRGPHIVCCDKSVVNL